MFDKREKLKTKDNEDKYNSIRKQAELQYQNDLKENRIPKKENKSGIKSLFDGWFSQNAKKHEDIELHLDDGFDIGDIDINTYKPFSKKK